MHCTRCKWSSTPVAVRRLTCSINLACLCQLNSLLSMFEHVTKRIACSRWLWLRDSPVQVWVQKETAFLNEMFNYQLEYSHSNGLLFRNLCCISAASLGSLKPSQFEDDVALSLGCIIVNAIWIISCSADRPFFRMLNFLQNLIEPDLPWNEGTISLLQVNNV